MIFWHILYAFSDITYSIRIAITHFVFYREPMQSLGYRVIEGEEQLAGGVSPLDRNGTAKIR